MIQSNSRACLPDFVGLPYGFRSADGGVDCWQLVRRAGAVLFGVEFPDPDCLFLSDAGRVMRENFARWDRVAVPEAGDVVCLTLRGQPLHTGLMLDARSFLHVLPNSTSRIDRVTDIAWRSRIDGFYRWRARS